MTTLAQLHDCHSCNDERSIVQKKNAFSFAHSSALQQREISRQKTRQLGSGELTVAGQTEKKHADDHATPLLPQHL